MQDDAPPPGDRPDSDAPGPNPLSSDTQGRVPPGADRLSSGDAPPDDPESAYQLLQRGRVLMRQRHNAQAAVVLERAARLEPGRGSILEALGRANFNAGHHQRAHEVFAALLDVDPSSHYAHFALAQSLRKLGRSREAVTHLRLACALDPGSALYRGALARTMATLPNSTDKR
jgi:Flp pilus assembly protein TadD